MDHLLRADWALFLTNLFFCLLAILRILVQSGGPSSAVFINGSKNTSYGSFW